jgi:hypothetical protein
VVTDMAAVIALRPKTARGREILDMFEERFGKRPDDDALAADGTRRYLVDTEDADVDAFDSMLDRIDSTWQAHLTNWRDG